MKNKILAFLTMASIIMLTGCEFDNYEEPTSTLSGRVTYQGEPVGVRSNFVQLELWQPGYAFFQKIPVYVAWDGTYSASLFDGDYQITRLRGNGPWADQTDTIDVQVRGNTIVDVPVEPFFLVKNETIAKAGSAVNASFNLQQVNATRGLERVSLFIGPTTIVDATNQQANVQKLAAEITDLNQPVSLSVNLPAALAAKSFVYARVGVKAVGVNELIYSAPQKIQLK